MQCVSVCVIDCGSFCKVHKLNLQRKRYWIIVTSPMGNGTFLAVGNTEASAFSNSQRNNCEPHSIVGRNKIAALLMLSKSLSCQYLGKKVPGNPKYEFRERRACLTMAISSNSEVPNVVLVRVMAPADIVPGAYQVTGKK